MSLARGGVGMPKTAVIGAALIWAFWVVCSHAFTPTEAYDVRRVHGWTILVSPGFADDKDARDGALAELDRQLGNIAGAVPEPALGYIRETRIWLEYRADRPRRAVYHRSAGWLEKNGYNPAKAKAVEVDQGIVTRRQTAPWSMIHELAHAYYDTVLRRQSAALDQAYADAVATGRYADVMRNSGRRQEAYAIRNVSEFFAEHSEAYFGENDFEPFNREQLQAFDPQAFAVLERLWRQ
ncbi:MAG: hypothetical protein AAFY74_18690 [Pseudomonadota bacterium]